MQPKKVLIACATALALALMPATALASPLVAAAPDTASANTRLETQAKPKYKTVYLIAKVDYKGSDDKQITRRLTFTYNKQNLLTKANLRMRFDGEPWRRKHTVKYWYKGATIKKMTDSGWWGTHTTTFTLDKKNRWKKSRTDTPGDTLYSNYAYDKQGRLSRYHLKKVVHPEKEPAMVGYDMKLVNHEYYRLKYGKRGLGPKTLTHTTKHRATWSCTYNEHGDRNSCGLGLREYEGDLLVKEGHWTYTYKKVKVKASLVKTIKAQQWAMINDNENGAIGPYIGFIPFRQI